MRPNDTRLYTIINQMTKLRQSVPTLISSSGELAVTAYEKANMFAQFYSSMQRQNDDMGSTSFDHEVKQTVEDFLSQPATTMQPSVSVSQVQVIVNRLNTKKSPGPDKVTNAMLKN